MFGRFQLTGKDKADLNEAIARELAKPPTIGVVGVSGTGKSSTINTLFKTQLAISHTTACTKHFEANEVALEMIDGQAAGQQTTLTIYDAPGLWRGRSKGS